VEKISLVSAMEEWDELPHLLSHEIDDVMGLPIVNEYINDVMIDTISTMKLIDVLLMNKIIVEQL
jgi:hypothetical protein